MNKFELKPTDENLKNTFFLDSIQRNKDIFSFAYILNNIDDSCSIAIDGRWGSGKTFFVKQVKMFLDSNNDFTDFIDSNDKEKIKNIWKANNPGKELDFQPQVCVYYDAWENDNDEDPVLSLIFSIISNVYKDFEFEKNIDFLKPLGNILEFFSGINVNRIIESLRGEDPLRYLKKQKNLEGQIQDFFNMLIAERGNRLVIFIDELDRCKPSFTVKLLERIKHYFNDDRITFVFSINALELQHTIKMHYGNDFDACRYLDRFFDLRFSLPSVDKNIIYSHANIGSNFYYDQVCKIVIDKFDLSIREMEKYLYAVKVAAYGPTHTNNNVPMSGYGNALEFGLMFIVPIIIGLKIVDIKRYEDFVNGKDCTPMLEILSQISTSAFIKLCESKETFTVPREDETKVNVDDKLKMVYNALFVQKYKPGDSEIRIGIYEFSNYTQKEILKAAGLMSIYTKID